MSTAAASGPPGYAWDWLARQRLAWLEAARRVAETGRAARGPHPDVPDWSSLIDDSTGGTRAPTQEHPSARSGARDWRALHTRAEVMAALREDYPIDAAVRRATDAAVTELVFLGRLDVGLAARGVRSIPRGMQWWWTHLGGAAPLGDTGARHDASARGFTTEPRAAVPIQLQLADVMAGYGDAVEP